ncbi:unnamed protein product [Phytophthora fragariaefolia]|uniref:Unnamed protein product n=1 Tax=Phytophthora fragariaefolia TaxID=1490495 RepID=A0A9W6XTD7_9STRA|nr:unnamed protein product [Phytophthora fragariaefolia]
MIRDHTSQCIFEHGVLAFCLAMAPNLLPYLSNFLRPGSPPTVGSIIQPISRRSNKQRSQRKILTVKQLMSDTADTPSQVPTRGTPPRRPVQPPDTTSLEAGASGSGGAGGSRGATSGSTAEAGAPQRDVSKPPTDPGDTSMDRGGDERSEPEQDSSGWELTAHKGSLGTCERQPGSPKWLDHPDHGECGAQPGPYVFSKDADSDEEHKDVEDPGSNGGSKDTPFDFSQDPAPPSTPRTPTTEDAMDPQESLALTEQDPREALAYHAVVWDKQRRDLQMAMRSGLDYTDAFELVTEDNVAHTQFPVGKLTVMLVWMMYWGKLDQTPCAKYVPSWCYKKAESHLEKLNDPPER